MKDTLGFYNPLRYRGYVYDTEYALYYLQSRYYDPLLGRFINADAFTSTGQGLLGNNMFAYCGNNPVSRADTEGNRWRYVIAEVETEETSEDGDSKKYKTTITYIATDESLFGCTFEPRQRIVYEVPFEYTVSENGQIHFDNYQLAATHLTNGTVRNALVDEMYAVAINQNETALQGRSKSGLSAEMYIHFVVHQYKLPFYYENSHQTDMGSRGKNSNSYDWNAKYFEVLFGWTNALF